MKKAILTVIKTLIFFIGWGVMIGFIPDIPTKNHVFLRLWWEFVPFILVIIFTVFFVCVIERGKIKVPLVSNLIQNTFVGLMTGILWLGIVVAILMAIGVMKIEGQNKIEFIYIWIIASLLNVAMQELLLRGYLYQLIKYKYNSIISAIITTILFTAIHGGAFEAGIIPVLNVVTMSIFVTLLLEYTGTLLAPIIVHFVWNTVGAIILGGVSLADDYPHLLNSVFQSNSLLSGGAYKIEGSIIVLIVNVMLIVGFTLLNIKKKRTVDV